MLCSLKSANTLISSIASGIERQEGFTSGTCTKCVQNNNPGALTAGPGQIGTAGGLAVFPDVATGEAALDNQIQLNINRGLTLDQFFAGGTSSSGSYYPGYAPAAAGNDPATYASNVALWVGIPADIPLNQIDPNSLTTGLPTSGDGIPADSSMDDGSVVLTDGSVVLTDSGIPTWAWIVAGGLAALAVYQST